MINVPKLDLSKVKPYDKSKPQSQTLVPVDLPEKQLKTITYGASSHSSTH